tara:strand:+ start:676 stop:1194 length:519 start_codon:yes stop_codon:yes gene_type:complete
MLARNLLLIIVLSLMASCASSPYIQTDSDRNYNLSSYKSFKVESPNVETTPELISINPILIQRIGRAVEYSLEEKGLISSDKPDLVVRFYLGTKREVDRSSDFGGYGYYGRYYDSRDQRYIRSDKDEISLRFHDGKSDEVVWYAFTRYNRSKSQSDQEAINKLIKEAVSNFN